MPQTCRVYGLNWEDNEEEDNMIFGSAWSTERGRWKKEDPVSEFKRITEVEEAFLFFAYAEFMLQGKHFSLSSNKSTH
jgi:hypothetical protein